jgi:hypothetical protein
MSKVDTTSITYGEVMDSIEACKRGLQTAATHVVWQIENRVWTVTGHANWDEFREAYYGGPSVILPTDDRKVLVPKLRQQGMSQQQIADTLGVDQKTVSNDLNRNIPNEDQPTTIVNSRGQERPATYQRTTPSLTVVPEVEEQAETTEPEGGSACFPDPSDGGNLMKDTLRSFTKTLASYYYSPTTKSLDVLDAWLVRQQKASQQARKKIAND